MVKIDMRERNAMNYGIIFLAVFLFLIFGSVRQASATGETCGMADGKVAAKCVQGVETVGGSFNCPEKTKPFTPSNPPCKGTGDVCCSEVAEKEPDGWMKFSEEKCLSLGGKCNLWSTSCDSNEDKLGICNDSPIKNFACCIKKDDPKSPTSQQKANSQNSQSGTGANSDSGGLVPCTNDCTLCHVIIGFKRIFDWLMGMLFVTTVLIITVAGVFYMVSSGNKGMIDKAKTGITYAIVAFVIGMGCWLAVNMVMTMVGFKNPSGGNWWEFTCDTDSIWGKGWTGGGSNSGGNNPTQPKKCCVLSNTQGQGDYGKKENCPEAKQSGPSKADCEKQCESGGGTPESITQCKSYCKDSEAATCEKGTLTDNCNSNPACGSGGVGCGKVVEAGKQMMSSGRCWYCNTFQKDMMFKSTRSYPNVDPDCQRMGLNGCSQDPGFTDCQDFARASYKKAGCSFPSGNSTTLNGQADKSMTDLKSGDVLTRNGHVAVCENDGCSTIIHASSTREGVIESNANIGSFSGVIRSSKLCTSCNQ